MSTKTFTETVRGNSYVGRGIVVGQTPDGRAAVTAYFIMGRSVNSRNRIFEETEDGIRTCAFDPDKLSDPSLIIYRPVRRFKNHLIVTNGDQTDTIRDTLAGWDKELKSYSTQLEIVNRFLKRKGIPEMSAAHAFEAALETREFEPDAPNFTPRISGMLTFDKWNGFNYRLHICKAADSEGTNCTRCCYRYNPTPGLGHFIHTYRGDGSPLPSFEGEPEKVAVADDIDAFTEEIWNALDGDNKVSLYVCYHDLEKNTDEIRIVNKNR